MMGSLDPQIQSLARRLVAPLRAWFAGVEQGVPTGTSFPASPATGQRFWRSDLGWLCYYDGTRWLTAHEYTLSFQGATAPAPLTMDSAVANNFQVFGRLKGGYEPYLVRVDLSTFVFTTNNGSNYWTVTVNAYNQTFLSSTNVYQVTTAGSTVATWTDQSGVVSANTGTTWRHIVIAVAITAGSPGVIRLSPTVTYRLIVT